MSGMKNVKRFTERLVEGREENSKPLWRPIDFVDKVHGREV